MAMPLFRGHLNKIYKIMYLQGPLPAMADATTGRDPSKMARLISCKNIDSFFIKQIGISSRLFIIIITLNNCHY